MKLFKQHSISLLLMFLSLSVGSLPAKAQQASVVQATVAVPRLISFSGRLTDAQSKPMTGIAGVTFAIYKDQNDGAPLWLETQNVSGDAKGYYTVQLGATRSEGLPMELFTSGEARWLGVRINGGEEQARVLLLSVPYALKAADAETVGGLPASAFVLAGAANSAAAQSSAAPSSPSASAPPPAGTTPVTTAGGTANKLAKFDAAADITNSQIFDNGTNVGIGNTAPASKLDVSGGGIFRGLLSLPATGAATTSAGKNSQPFSFTASSYNSGTGTAVNQNFRWQAEPTGNNTTGASGTLNLLHSVGANTPAETGLKIAGNGQITFASGQKFPSAGTVSSVGLSAPASDFTVSGSPVTTTGTLALKWNTAPTPNDTANAIVKRDANGEINVTEVDAETTIPGLIAVLGSSDSNAGVAGTSNTSEGVYGSGSTGVYGQGFGNPGYGVEGTGSFGVYGTSSAAQGRGVVGQVTGSGSIGVVGEAASGATGIGVVGKALPGSSGMGVWGESFASSGSSGYGPDGVDGLSHSSGGSGVFASNDSTGDALAAYNQSGGYAGFFNGAVDVDGNLSKAGGSFKIDDPLDPANKYLYHSFVESPDMMNIYNGNVITDANGEAVVQLPDWFEALNRDFRYQLTVIGTFAQAIVESEVANHQFTIKTDKPSVKVSWQVTGIRQDAWANAHRIPVEVTKPEGEHGLYLHPELFGAPADKSIAVARHPVIKKLMEQKAASLKIANAR